MRAGLDEVEEYRLPEASELPSNEVGWLMEPRRAALLVHDMQSYFLGAFSSAPTLRGSLVKRAQRVLAASRRAGLPIFFSAQPGGMSDHERGLLADLWGPGMSADEAHRGILPEVAPLDDERVLTKWRYSAFHHSPLLAELHAAGRDQLVILGVYAHLGIIATSLDAYSNDIETFVVSDAIATFSRIEHERSLSFLVSSCAAVMTTCEVVGALDR